ncbi:heat shock protein DnaJ, putative [Perkinsus marinus ATCC 50983]|uniref:Heat shock protein DnaJ, putative n=1 Tax=Perkinsus marinus (strain ATCC 50983 / TXsc) TaxID=423536 RepID=C5KTH7_PERM5|nr:heat shock protein DnaJ, putative [Perkinsus marinus ATCC 50983]EER12282.1 heat shock protein DnaJ, putative [Perkinsus marinus ATCC 50983]|eukprot:XP_002780487.1 heat shock protein DnaJ, putative [Perkinsus marinus ATCC 50983]
MPIDCEEAAFYRQIVDATKDNASSIDLYQVLRIERETTPKEIKKAYRRLAVRWHPDKHRNDFDKAFAESVFKLIARAYEVLSDENSRADYDAGGFNGGIFCK